MFLTPAVVLQTAGGPEAIVTSALDRALCTVVGAVAAIIVLTAGHALIVRTSRKPSGPVNGACAGGGDVIFE